MWNRQIPSKTVLVKAFFLLYFVKPGLMPGQNILSTDHSLFFPLSRYSQSFIRITGSLLLLGVWSSFAGTITGTIHFPGKFPTATIEMTGDKSCIETNGKARVPSESVVVNPNHTLRNVFVYVKSGLGGKHFAIPPEKAVLTQKGCRYFPHVLGMMVHQPLVISNDDPTLHNVHALPQYSSQFNLAEPQKGMPQTKTFDKPEVMVRLKCDVHRWMSAYIGVLDHPFYSVSNENGTFTITNLPPGQYEIETWHEKFGTKTIIVNVGSNETKIVDVTYDTE
jgi:hypothetical protein